MIFQKAVSTFHSSHSLRDPGIAGKSPIHFINGYKLLRCKEAWFIGSFLPLMFVDFTATSHALNITIINLLVNISILLLLLFLWSIFSGWKLLGDMACTFNFDEAVSLLFPNSATNCIFVEIYMWLPFPVSCGCYFQLAF